MSPFLKKYAALAETVARKKGPFELFALFLREDAPGKWDLLIAGPWIEKDKQKAVRYISKVMRGRFKPNELVDLSRIVVLERSHPALAAFQRTVHVDGGPAEIENSNLFGLQVEHAYVFVAQKVVQPAPAK